MLIIRQTGLNKQIIFMTEQCQVVSQNTFHENYTETTDCTNYPDCYRYF